MSEEKRPVVHLSWKQYAGASYSYQQQRQSVLDLMYQNQQKRRHSAPAILLPAQPPDNQSFSYWNAITSCTIL